MAAGRVTLDALRLAHQEASQRLPYRFDRGLGQVGLIFLPQLARQYYDVCSPRNGWCFAHTGGDGVHFSVLGDGDRPPDDGPVVVTNPPAFGSQNHIVGENLHDFLCLGVHRGYFALEQLGYDLDLTLKAFTDPKWQPTEQWHESVGFELDECKRAIMQFLIERFDLKPWPNAHRYYALQAKYGQWLRLPDPEAT